MDPENRAENIILKFKQHLQQKWKKNKVKQHINKIIHYHAQKTFFSRYAAPLFLKVPAAQEYLSSKFSSSNVPLLEQVKILHSGFILNDKYSKSMDVIQIYFKQLTQYNLLEEFFFVLMHILYEIPCPIIPKELVDASKKQDLFIFVSPIIAFLIVYWFNSQSKKKIKTLEELIMRSGVKQLLKLVKVPKICKNQLSHASNLENSNQNQFEISHQNYFQQPQNFAINTDQKSLSSKQQPPRTSIEEEDTDFDQHSIASQEFLHDMSTQPSQPECLSPLKTNATKKHLKSQDDHFLTDIQAKSFVN